MDLVIVILLVAVLVVISVLTGSIVRGSHQTSESTATQSAQSITAQPENGVHEKLDSIEKHLQWQDKEAKRAAYGSYAVFGGAIALVGVSLWLGTSLLPANVLFWDYVFILAVGFGVMFFYRRKQSKIKD